MLTAKTQYLLAQWKSVLQLRGMAAYGQNNLLFFCQITYFTSKLSYYLIYLLDFFMFTIALLLTLLLLYPLSIWMT